MEETEPLRTNKSPLWFRPIGLSFLLLATKRFMYRICIYLHCVCTCICIYICVCVHIYNIYFHVYVYLHMWFYVDVYQ